METIGQVVVVLLQIFFSYKLFELLWNIFFPAIDARKVNFDDMWSNVHAQWHKSGFHKTELLTKGDDDK